MDIDKLKKLQEDRNGGRGITCVKHIINCLENNEIEQAQKVYQWDGDKIREYPFVQQWFNENMGCRTHLKKDCQDALCITLNKYNEDRIRKAEK